MTPTAPRLARLLADAFESRKVPYAIGGALALAVWGFPRATNDVDIDAFVGPEELGTIFEILESSGCDVDREEAVERVRERGDFRAFSGGMRIDVFLPSIPFYESVVRRVKEGPLEGRRASFLSPEDLAVFKLLFFRTKDILDVERLAAFLGTSFDVAYVRGWLVEIVGADDVRVVELDRIVAELT